MCGEGGTSGTLDIESMGVALATAQLALEGMGVPVDEAVFIDVGAGYGMALMAALVSGFHVAVGIEAGMGELKGTRGGNSGRGAGGGPSMTLREAVKCMRAHGLISQGAIYEVLWETTMGPPCGGSSAAVNYAECSDSGFSWGFSCVPPTACKVCFAFDAVFREECKQALYDFVCRDTSVKVFLTSAFNYWSEYDVSLSLAGQFTRVQKFDCKMLKSDEQVPMMMYVRA